MTKTKQNAPSAAEQKPNADKAQTELPPAGAPPLLDVTPGAIVDGSPTPAEAAPSPPPVAEPPTMKQTVDLKISGTARSWIEGEAHRLGVSMQDYIRSNYVDLLRAGLIRIDDPQEREERVAEIKAVVTEMVRQAQEAQKAQQPPPQVPAAVPQQAMPMMPQDPNAMAGAGVLQALAPLLAGLMGGGGGGQASEVNAKLMEIVFQGFQENQQMARANFNLNQSFMQTVMARIAGDSVQRLADKVVATAGVPPAT